MAEDSRDYIDRSISASEKMLGREPTPADIAGEFARMDLRSRSAVLLQMEADSIGSEMTVTEAARRLPYQRALKGTHEALRKVDR